MGSESGCGRSRPSRLADPPDDDAANPLLASVDEADWPATPAGQHYAAVRSAGRLVETARNAEHQGEPPPSRSRHPGAAPPRRRRQANDGLTPAEREIVAAWERDAGLLLAERGRQQRRGDGPIPVMLPARLSVSALVALARDPDELARQVRRPMPQPPARQARRGTAFHGWLEERFGQQRLIDDDDLFVRRPNEAARCRGLARPSGGVRGQRVGRPLAARGRGAVRHADRGPPGPRPDRRGIRRRPTAGSTWWTGRPASRPRAEAETDAVAVQLAAYRLAWATLAGGPARQGPGSVLLRRATT